MLLGPAVWIGLQWLLKRTAFGSQLRAATQDRAMLSALGVNPAPLMLAAVALGSALAGLGGVLSVPVSPVNLQMDMQIIVETFVVVVTGGLGSITGAFLAALLMGLVHAFGVAMLPEATLVLTFAVMGVVLLLRPTGLMGQIQSEVSSAQHSAEKFWNISSQALIWLAIGLCAALAVALWLGEYWTSLYLDALILLIFALSLQLAMSLGGLASFGHAAYLGLGAYGVALSGYGAFGVGAAALVALVFGWVVIRSSGVYLAMLSLALAQVLWAMASQWTGLTGGDNGMIGLQFFTSDWARLIFQCAVLGCAITALYLLHRLAQSRMGWALQASRDVPQRAAALGLSVAGLRYRVYVLSAALAGLAGVLMAVHKGSVFPSALSVSMSLDALLVVLLGGAHQLMGTLVGSLVMTGLSSELGRLFDYWRGLLGFVVLLLMLFAPRGVLGSLKR